MSDRLLSAAVAVAVAVALFLPAGARAQPRIEPSLVRSVAASGRAPAWIELGSEADLPHLAALSGVEIAEAGGVPVHFRATCVARLDAAGLRAIAGAPFVRRARLAPPVGIPPLDRSAEILGLAGARGLRPEGLYGRGVLVADLDSPIDPFHPAFFHGDAGWYDWIDRDLDGRFRAGDAIDLDRDGVADPGEAASELLAMPLDFGGASGTVIRGSGLFDPGTDWIYLDVDRDGVRGVGAESGWGDDAPGLGEPIFVPDDVDRDGVLDPEERVLRLGTPKVRAHRVDLTGFTGATHLFERGTSLSSALRDYTGGSYGYADTLHATGVVGILIADVPLIGRRWVGIAPEAEVVVASDIGDTNLDGLMWALAQRPDVLLHEYVLWTTVALDGSDPQSMLIDASSAEGVAHVCPAGNIGGSAKHAAATVGPGAPHAFLLEVASYYLELTVNVPVTSDVIVTLVEPTGVRHAFTGTSPLSDGTALVRQEASGVRTHRAITFAAYREGGALLPPGTYRLEVEPGPALAAAVTAHAFVYDEYGFAGGTVFVGDVTDASTMAWPSTADHCIAVGAHPGHTSDEGSWFRGDEPFGTIRGYSGRGPRLDGATTIGVSAPDNPLTPLGAGDAYPSMPGLLVADEGAFQIFSGTSGAGPHVAGTLALLAQNGVRGADAIDRVLGTATADEWTGPAPNDDHGRGRLDAGRALGVLVRGLPPDLSLVTRVDGEQIVVEPVVVDPDGEPVRVRWDFEYDGVWDTELEAPSLRRLDVPLHLRVEAQDPGGLRDQAALRVRSIVDPSLDAGWPDGGPRRDGGGSSDAGAGRRWGFAGCTCRAGHGGAPWALLLVAVLLFRRRGR